jgi:hypothetical protein
MNIFELVQNVDVMYNTRINGRIKPFGIRGAPGCGKTSILASAFRDALAKHTGKPVDVLIDILSTREAPDIRGLPIPIKTDPARPMYRYAVPDIVNRICNSPAYDDGVVIYMLDEFTGCSMDIQKVAADMIQRGYIGEYELPDNVWLIATGNRLSDSSGVQRQLAMLTNRMAWYEVELPFEHWLRHARAIALPPLCVAFAERFPKHFASEVPPRDGAFCTYRSFTEFSQYLKAFNSTRNKDLVHVEDSVWARNTADGMIGQAATLEFFAFCRVADQLPSRKDVLTKPESASVPAAWQIDAQYAAASMAVAIAMEDPLNVAPAVKYLMRLPTIELTVKAMVDLNTHSGGAITMNNPDASRWLSQHKALVTDAMI